MTAETKATLPDDLALERYGLQWNGPDTFVAQPMPDGYWTPWHIASARIAAQAEKIAALEAELAALKADPPYKSIRAGLLGRYTANLRERANIMHGALEWIKANWSNQDICHTDFRVRSFVEANTALAQSDGKAGE